MNFEVITVIPNRHRADRSLRRSSTLGTNLADLGSGGGGRGARRARHAHHHDLLRRLPARRPARHHHRLRRHARCSYAVHNFTLRS